MELKHLPKYKHITEHAETYANIDAGSLELFLSLFDISKKNESCDGALLCWPRAFRRKIQNPDAAL